ncbi:UDP-N-acetylmuramoylalanine-D-glutamate ligase [Candidatus Methylomirabilis oxygeniifera]|uniref:UDP-N-acetylmuramoylalanine--D-glutamate ligase n=1 Tax=Methylomirabilis oxygeniifera TaxID=671143 RepID=D5MI56_METO1|nr:UDP-N-acetylmuramoylalanine-D-glutamate ligase [Candidatus Methylomirabilis oxyfera]
MIDLAGKRVVVIGLARSGEAACRLLLKQGAAVVGTDRRGEREVGADLCSLEQDGVSLELGKQYLRSLPSADLVVVSPGIDLREPRFRRVREAGIPLIGEVELAYRYSDATFIGITGTNGKSTTTTLIGAMLKQAGLPSYVAGNIGTPLCRVAPSLAAGECVVAELSSFQLETIDEFRPRVALLLNLAPDHLDRYDQVEDYYRAKARIFENQRPSDFAVINADDPLVLQVSAQARGRRIAFSRTRPLDTGAYVEDDQLMLALDGVREVICRKSELKIQGVHNLENALAAGLAAAVAGTPTTAIRIALTSFEGLEHRLEFVAEIAGVRYINDSKGTNVGAVVRSLESFTNPVVLIAGGRDKHGDFAPLIPLVRERVKRLILIGEAAETLRRMLASVCPTEVVSSLEEAVRRAAAAASPGEVVLLSPACASFDMFTDFEDRGRVFKAAVRGLVSPADSIQGQA